MTIRQYYNFPAMLSASSAFSNGEIVLVNEMPRTGFFQRVNGNFEEQVQDWETAGLEGVFLSPQPDQYALIRTSYLNNEPLYVSNFGAFCDGTQYDHEQLRAMVRFFEHQTSPTFTDEPGFNVNLGRRHLIGDTVQVKEDGNGIFFIGQQTLIDYDKIDGNAFLFGEDPQEGANAGTQSFLWRTGIRDCHIRSTQMSNTARGVASNRAMDNVLHKVTVEDFDVGVDAWYSRISVGGRSHIIATNQRSTYATAGIRLHKAFGVNLADTNISGNTNGTDPFAPGNTKLTYGILVGSVDGLYDGGGLHIGACKYPFAWVPDGSVHANRLLNVHLSGWYLDEIEEGGQHIRLRGDVSWSQENQGLMRKVVFSTGDCRTNGRANHGIFVDIKDDGTFAAGGGRLHGLSLSNIGFEGHRDKAVVVRGPASGSLPVTEFTWTGGGTIQENSQPGAYSGFDIDAPNPAIAAISFGKEENAPSWVGLFKGLPQSVMDPMLDTCNFEESLFTVDRARYV